MDLHISLLSIALATLINLWLSARTGRVRAAQGIAHGHGGHAPLERRMRAQANLIEYTPFALLLIVALELSGRGGWLLALAAILFLFGRIMHAFGMDAENVPATRTLGMALTLPVLLGLAIAAVLAAVRLI